MILNLLRVEALRVEEMIKRSFSENASQRLLPDQQKKVIEVNNYLYDLLISNSFGNIGREEAVDAAETGLRYLSTRY